MPWDKDENGYPVYKVSIYTKEELPTWNEMYNEFYKEKAIFYDPKDPNHQIADLYWKIPHRKYLVSIICNQFNKMIFEDGFKDRLFEIVGNQIHAKICDIRFICDGKSVLTKPETTNPDLYYDEYIEKLVSVYNVNNDEVAPPIYTIPMPNGQSNPFIVFNNKRVNINDIHEKLELYPVISLIPDVELTTLDKTDYKISYIVLNTGYDDRSSLYWKIIDFMMKPIIEYFEGEGVGWKDSNGKIIEGDPSSTHCNGSGYDPAL